MTQRASIPPDRTDELTGKTGRLGRKQIEQALIRVLDTGVTAIPQQLRYVLALAQVNDNNFTSTPYSAKPMSISAARLSVLESLASTLNKNQIKQLIRDIQKIEDIDTRIILLSRIAIFIEPNDFFGVVKEIWQQVNYISDIVVRTECIYQIAPLLTLIHDEPATSTPLLNILRVSESIKNSEARLRSLVAVAPHLPVDLSVRTFSRVLNDLEAYANDSLRMKTLVSMSADVPDELKTQALNIAVKIVNPSERARVLTALAQNMPQELRPRMREDALDAINTIETEEDTAEALIAFAPHLDYASEKDTFPAILAKALTITVGITRRHIRARVLVAIAPHLPTDLQGEALAAVHSLSNEQTRAMLLSELAPNLPPNMLVASLAVAHTMVTQDARVHALTALAQYVPASARAQTIRDALAAASNLPHYLERVTALVNLIDVLPDDLMEMALANALESAKSIENENAQARALNQLGTYLSENLLEQALDIALNIQNPNQRMNAIIGIIGNLVSEERLQEARENLLGCAKSIHLEFKQARALVTILPHLSQEMFIEVEQLADYFFDAFDRVSVYLAIAQNSPPENRPPLIVKAWTGLHHIEDGYDRASMIAALSPFLPDRANKDLATAIETAIDIIEDGYDKASAIRILMPMLSGGSDGNFVPPDMPSALEKGLATAITIPDQALRADYLVRGITLWVNNVHDKEQSFHVWRILIWHLRSLPLSDVLLCFAAMMPLLQQLTDGEMMQQVTDVLGIR
jgi:hypothetical protein